MELSDVAVFVKVIQAGSFTEAARRLGAPKSTVSTKVSSLERRLGVTLIQRTTRKLHLTEQGTIFFQSCARALSEIESAEAFASSGQKTPQGRVILTAPADSAKMLAEFLKGFLSRYPAVEVDLMLTNRYVDLVGEGVDVAIRGGKLDDSSLIAKKVAYTKRALFASPTYILGSGLPKAPSDLEAHQCVLFSANRYKEWELHNGNHQVKVKVSGSVTADELNAIRELALQDFGIVLLPTFICNGDVADKRLVPVLPGWVADATPICIVYPSQKYQHPKVKVLVEEAVKHLKDHFDRANKICGALLGEHV